MIRLLVIFTVALGLSLGVSTGWVVVRGEQPAAVVADSTTKRDSVAQIALADSTKPNVHNDTTPDSVVVNDERQYLTTDAHVGGDSVAAAAPTSVPTPVFHADSGVVRRLASIFAAMPARDAARVLSEMDNSDVQLILLSLPRKQQAAILSSLPANRAALITKATLRDTL